MLHVALRGIIAFKMKNNHAVKHEFISAGILLPADEFVPAPNSDTKSSCKESIGQYKAVLDLLAEIIADDLIARRKNND